MEGSISSANYSNYNLLLQKHKERSIERLTCCSGGARGNSLPGVRKALVDTGVLSTIKEIAGSSAGALFASLLATNVSDEQLYEALANTPLFELLGEKTHPDRRNDPGVSFLSRDGVPLENKIRELILTAVREFLVSDTFLQKIPVNGDSYLAGLHWRFQHEPTPKFTYRDLKKLHEAFPEQFKKLIIVAVNHETGEPFVFDADLTPDVDVPVSPHASAAIPGVLEPVVVEINGETFRLIDGGYYEHLPTDFFDKNEHNQFVKNTKPENSMVLIFSDVDYTNSTGYKALYGAHYAVESNAEYLYDPPLVEVLQRNWLGPYFSGITASYRNTDKWNESYKRIRSEYPLNSIVMDVSDIKAYHYNAATKFGKEMCTATYLDLVFHITSHELDNPDLFPKYFFENLASTFEIIYEAVLIGKYLDPEYDGFTIKLREFKEEINAKLKNKSSATQARQISEFLRDAIRGELHSDVSMALRLAVGYCNSTLSPKALFEQICTGITSYRERGYFEVLLFVGLVAQETTDRTVTLEVLVKQMDLENELDDFPVKEVFQCLTKIDSFRDANLYRAAVNDPDEVRQKPASWLCSL